jgi:hypothetical protein
MSTYNVRITDKKNKSFGIQIEISLLSLGSEGTFKVMDKNYIAYNNGVCRKIVEDIPGGTQTSLVFYGDAPNGWGLRLEDWQGMLGVRDKGIGFIHLNWARWIEPGHIDWVKTA